MSELANARRHCSLESRFKFFTLLMVILGVLGATPAMAQDVYTGRDIEPVPTAEDALSRDWKASGDANGGHMAQRLDPDSESSAPVVANPAPAGFSRPSFWDAVRGYLDELRSWAYKISG